MVAAGCLGDTSAPRGPQPAAFSVVPRFPGHAAASVPFNRVRVTLSRTASTALDTTIDFPAGADSLVVRLSTEIFGTSETLTLNLAMIDAANDTVFRGGPLPVTLTATGSRPQALPIPLRYVGVGANAKTVRITPKTTSVLFRDSVTLTATAYDTAGQPIPGTPVSWRSLDSTLARVPADTVGKVLVGIVRGVARVEAMLPTDIADTAQVTVQPVAAGMGLQSGGGQTGGVGAPLAQPMVVRVKAADSLGVPGVAVTFTVVSGGGVVSQATDTTNANGDASTIWTLGGTLGLQSLKATIAAAPAISTTAIATGVAGAAKRLAFLVQPPAVASGAAMVPAVQVAAQDSFGNTATTFTDNVSLAIGTNPGPSTLGGTTTVAAVAGVATFSTLTLNIAGTGYTLVAGAASLTGATSNPFTVTAAAPAQLAFAQQPSNATAGAALAPAVTVQVRDASGNLVTTATTAVTVAIGTNPGGGTLSGTTTVNAAAGVATYANLGIDKAGTGYTLAASAGGLTGATSAAFNVAAGAASGLAITTQPSSTAQSGSPFSQQPVIQLQDALGNAVSQSGVVVTAAIASGGGTLGGTPTATTNASGVATFANLSVTGLAGARTLTFTAAGLAGVTSGTITLTAGAASRLAITTQPSAAAQSGVAFAPQPVIQIQDASGNAVSQSGVVVTAAIASGGGTLGGTLTATTTAGGTASFTNLSITGAAGPRTLAFTAIGLTSVTSGTIVVGAGAPVQLAVTTQPSSSAQSGAAFAQQPVIQLQDSSGNAVSQSGVVVSAAIASGGGTLGGTLTATTNPGGAATFTNLSITGSAGARTLTFTASGLTATTSGTITITAGAASQLAITTQPSATAASGAAFAQQPVIQIQDASGNAVSQSGVVVTAAIASGGGTLGGTPTATTNASGVATFANLSITGLVGARTLTFTATGLTGATSGTVTVTVGTASQLVITTEPPASVPAQSAFGLAVTARDGGGNTVTTFSGPVTVAIGTNPSGGTLSGTLTVSASSGVATFSGLSIDNVGTGYTLTAASAGLTSATSTAFNVTAPLGVNAWINPSGGNWSVAANWSKGAVPVATDTVTITQSGSYTVNLDVSATVAKLTAGAASGTQTLSVAANTLTVGAGNGTLAANTVLNLSGTGTITGAGALTVAGAFNWTGGSLGAVTAGGGIKVPSGGTLGISPAANVQLQNYTLEVDGTGTWTGTAFVNTGSGATLRVGAGGVLTVSGDPTISYNLGGAAPVLNNLGTVNRTTSANSFVVNAPVSGTGAWNVQSGSINLQYGGTVSGPVSVSSGAALNLITSAGALTFDATSAITGAGTVSFQSGTVTLAGAYNLTGPTQIAGGTANFNGTSAAATTLSLASGTLGGSGVLSVSGNFSWTGGALGNSGLTTKVLASATWTMAPAAAVTFVADTLELSGSGTWTGTQSVGAGSGAILRVMPGGTLTIQGDPTFAYTQGGALPLLDNQGTINRTTSANPVILGVPFNQAGTLNITTGSVNVANGGTMSGPVSESPGTVLLFSNGSVSLANNFAVTGSSGMTQITGGTVGGLTPTDTAFFDNLTISGGSLSLAGGTIKTPFEMLWTGPATVSGGTLFVPATAGLTMSFASGAPALQNAKLLVAGSGGWTATTPLSSGSGDTIRVLAGGNLAFTGAGGGFLYNQGGAPSVLDNRGTVISATTPGTAFTVSAEYTEQGGTLDVTSGRLRLAGGSTPPFLGTATVNVGDTLELAGGTFQMNGPLTIGGGGTLLVSAGTLAPNGVGLGLTGNFATSGTGALVMNLPGDSLDISGNATFGGAAGTISNGVIRVGGNFTQTGSANFAPGPNTSPEHVVLTGSGPQTISFADPLNSFFRRLWSQQGANGNITVNGTVRAGLFQWFGNNAMAGSTGDFIADTITGAATGSNITVNKVEVDGLVNTSGFFEPDTAVFTGASQVIPSLYAYRSVRVSQASGTATFSGNPSALTNLVVTSGTLDLTGRQVGVTGFFQTTGTGALRMTGATDSLGVGGSATFGGGSTSGLLTAGIITVNGDFTQTGGTSVSSYAPTLGGTHRLSLRGTVTQNVSMANPAAAQSHFDVLEIQSQNRNVVLQTSAFVNDTLWMQASAFPYSLTGAGTSQRLSVAGLLRMDFSTGSPSLKPPVVELSATPIISPTLAGTFSPDTTVFNGGIATLPTGAGIAYKSVRVNTAGAFTSPGVTYNGDLIVSSGTYTIGSGVDSVAGFLRTEGTGALSMVAIVAAPTVAVRDSAVFAGGPSTALTGGVLRIWGNFFERGTGGQFAPTGTRVSFQRAAAGAQTIQFADSSGSFFRDLVLNGTVADTIRLLSNVQVQDSTVMTGTSTLVSNAAEALKLPAAGILRVHSQAVLRPFRAEAGTWVLDSTFIGGTAVRFSPDTAVLLNASNFYGTGTIGVAGISSTPSPLFAWKSVRMTGGTLPSSGTTYAGNLIVQGGTYTESTFGVTDSIAGFLRTEGTGVFLMPTGTAAPVVAVHDSAVFAGGADTLAAGTLRLYGGFAQRGAATSFVGGAGHTVQFAGATQQSIAFANPGSAASTFGNVLLNRTSGAVSQATSVSLGSNVFVSGVLSDTSAAVADTIAGNGNTLTTGGFNLNDTYISNAPVVVPSGTALLTGNTVTFANMSPTAVQLTFTRGTAITLNAFAFLVAPTGAGKYFSVTNSLAGAPATFSFTNPVQPTQASPPAAGTYTKAGATLPIVLWGSVTLP